MKLDSVLLQKIIRATGNGGPPRQPPALPEPRTREWKYLGARQLKGLHNLLFCAKTVVEGAYAGRHRSPYKGASSEFVDYREYHPGDEIRKIDWKAVARTDRLVIRLFEKQTDMNCYLMVDASASMAYGGKAGTSFLDHNALSKLDYALCLAASLAYLVVKQSDQVGLTMFANGIRHHVPPGGTFAHLYGMLNLMEKQLGCDRTRLGAALREAFPLCRRKGLLILLSDLLEEDGGELFSALNMYRHRGFEVIMFHILHPHELTLPPEASVDFIDSETREAVNSLPGEIAESYREQIQGWISELRAGAQGRRIDYHLVSTDTPYEAVLQNYLLRRRRL